jgi:peptidoglycan/LPS O-acetylase OafA/YrhL
MPASPTWSAPTRPPSRRSRGRNDAATWKAIGHKDEQGQVSFLDHAPAQAVPTTPTSDRIGALDALRGCAIVPVVASHYLPGRLIPANPMLVDVLGLGGVILFFFLSGFFIDRVLSQDDNLTGYALRRLFRILPAYWFSIAVLLGLAELSGQAPYGPAVVLWNMLLVQDVMSAPLITGVFWTLIIEARFYLVAPLLAGRRAGVLIGVLLGALLLNAAWAIARGYPSNLLTYLAYCLMGMCIGRWHRGLLSSRGLAAIVAAGVLWTAVFHPRSPIAIAVAVAIGAILLVCVLKYAIEVPGFRLLGRVSYSWYLLHVGIGDLLFQIVDRWEISPALSTVPVTAVSLLVAWLSYRLVEQPGIAIGKRLERSLAPLPKA